MPKLQKMLRELIKKQCEPETVIERIALRKLKAQGVPNPEPLASKIGALVASKLAGNETGLATFSVGEDDVETVARQVDLKLGAEDVDAYRDDLHGALKEVFPELSAELAKVYLDGIARGDSEPLRDRQAMRGVFEINLQARWGDALQSYELFVWLSHEIGETAAKELARLKRKKIQHLVTALIRMHARACQVAHEILVLMRSGFADGAHARWRTLHEMAVTCALLSEHGEDLAERYLLHEVVDSYKAALQYNKHAAQLGEPPFSDKELARMASDVDRLCERFGKAYRNSHGWASEVLKQADPNFSDLERAASFDHLRPYYKLASYNVHATAKGVQYRLGAMGDRSLLLAGPSNAGLEDPGRFASYSLLQISLSLLFVRTTLDALVHGQILIKLSDEARQAFETAARKLERDERRLRRSRARAR